MGQSNWLIAPQKSALVRHPQLINMKQNKCPSFRMVGCSLQGVLAQAKNGDELFWEEKFHVTNGKAQACIQGALPIFLLSLGRGRDSFSFFPSSQCVPTMFQVQVPNGFSLCSPSSQHVFHSTSLLSHMLSQMLSSFQLGQRGWTQNGTFYFVETPKFLLNYWWANQIDSLQTKIELGRHFI